jgi:hypothetical protein
MKMKRFCTMSLASAVVAVFCVAAFSQVTEPPPVVFGSGGGSSTDGTLYLSDTVGPPALGTSTESNTVLHAGFWYLPDRLHIGPTSAVAIAAFEAAASHNGIELHWTIASADGLEGFNVYRSVDGETGFVRLNDNRPLGPNETSYVDKEVQPRQTYWYRIGAVDRDGEFLSKVQSVTTPHRSVEIRQNYPNPFNPSTTIDYYLPRHSHVTLSIFDVNGQRVRSLVDRPVRLGHHSVVWNGVDDNGNRVSSGVYFYRLRVGNTVITKKLVVVK